MNKEDLKEGDILWMIDDWIFIFDSLCTEGDLRDIIIYKALIRIHGDNLTPYCAIPPAPSRGIGCFYDAKRFRYATNYETRKLFEEMDKRGFRYDEKTKRVERRGWKEYNKC